MTKDFLENIAMSCDALSATFEKAVQTLKFREEFCNGKTANLYVTIDGETAISHNLKSDKQGEIVKTLLDQQLNDCKLAFVEIANSILTFCEEEEEQ